MMPIKDMGASLPLVSVCIPVYNHEDFVLDSIVSVIGQDYKNIELIVINDGSTDSSKEQIDSVLAACEKRFSRFSFITRSNRGLCATLNEAIAWAQGEYFSVIASDDIWLSNKITKQVHLFSKCRIERLAAITGQMLAIDESGNLLPKSRYVYPESTLYDFETIYRGQAKLSAPTAFFKLDTIKEVGGYNESYIIEDYYMWLALSSNGYFILSVDTLFAKYRIHGDNTHKKVRKMHQSIEEIFELFAPNNIEGERAKQRLACSAYGAACLHDKRYAMKLIVSKRINPLEAASLKSTVLLLLPASLVISSRSFIKSLLNKLGIMRYRGE